MLPARAFATPLRLYGIRAQILERAHVSCKLDAKRVGHFYILAPTYELMLGRAHEQRDFISFDSRQLLMPRSYFATLAGNQLGR